MHRKYLFLPDGINRFGYVPRSKKFTLAKIQSYGAYRKDLTDYCRITFESGDTELSRYDEKAKRWSVLCFPKTYAFV